MLPVSPPAGGYVVPLCLVQGAVRAKHYFDLQIVNVQRRKLQIALAKFKLFAIIAGVEAPYIEAKSQETQPNPVEIEMKDVEVK